MSRIGKNNQWRFVPQLSQDEVRAIRAIADGDATPYQQQLGLHTITNKFARAQEMLYVPGSFDETAFLEGRGFVGQQILKIIKVPVGQLDNIIDNDSEGDSNE